MSETTPRETKPNFEPPFDIIRHVLDEQMLDGHCDELEQMSRALNNLEAFNRKLAEHTIRAAFIVSEWYIEYDGYDACDGRVKATPKQGAGVAQGYVEAINYGRLMDTPGYMIHIVNPDNESVNPFFPDHEPVSTQIIVSASRIIDYRYLPIEMTS